MAGNTPCGWKFEPMADLVPPLTFHGRAFRARGINLGCWLNLEDFMLGTPGTEWQVLREWSRFCGPSEASRWHERFLDQFLAESDLRFIASAGFNCVRLPIHWRRLESAEEPGIFLESGFTRISWLMDAAQAHGLAVVLDLHVAPGGQNNTPPADNTWGAAMLWSERAFRDRTVAIWNELARRYASHPALLGFNVLNEPQLDQYQACDESAQAAAMNSLYASLLDAIRNVSPASWIIFDAPLPRHGFSRLLDVSLFADPFTAWSFHHYPLAPWDQGINAEHRKPDNNEPSHLREFVTDRIREEIAFAEQIGRPVLLGEFGFHRQWDAALGLPVVKAQIEVAEECGFGWLIWAYKDIGVMGLVSPRSDSPWRQWVDRPAWCGRLAEALDAAAHLSLKFQEHLPYSSSSARTHDFSAVLARVAVRSVLNQEFFRDFATAFSPEERLAMADSFALSACAPDTDYLAVLQSCLKTGVG